MPLADDIRTLKARTLAALAAAHDYYADTKTAWEIVEEAVAGSLRPPRANPVTGTLMTHAALAAKADEYIAGPLAEATFQQFLSIFETFVFDLLRLWLLAYPQSLAAKKLDFRAVLDAPDKESIALAVVNRELNDVLYERPAGWFAYLDKLVKLDRPTADEIERLTEAKASRDVIVHAQGVVGKTYLLKAGQLARFAEGRRIDLPEPYHRAIYELLLEVVAAVSDAAAAKA